MLLESEPLHVKPRHDEFIEVAYECRKQKKDRVLCHERLWEPVPAESIVHIIEYTFLATTFVVEFYNVSCRLVIVIGKDATVSVFTFQ